MLSQFSLTDCLRSNWWRILLSACFCAIAVYAGRLMSITGLSLLAIAAIGIAAVAIMSRPHLGLWLVLLLAPLELVLPGIAQDVSATKLLGLATFGSVITQIVTRRASVPRRPVLSEKFLLLWLLASTLSLVVAPDTRRAADALGRLVQMVGLYAIIQLLVINLGQLRHAIWLLIISGLVLPVLAYLQYSAHVAQVYVEYGGNWLGLLLCIMVPMTYWMRELVTSLVQRRLLTGLLVVYVVSIPLSWSRGSVIALAVTLLYILVCSRASAQTVLVVLVGAVAFLWIVPPSVRFHLMTISFNDPHAWSGRLNTIWPSVVNIVRDHGLLGAGLGNLELYMFAYQSRLGVEKYRLVGSAHNNYLQVWAETGVLGIIGWVGFEAATFLALLSARRAAQGAGKNELVVFARIAEAMFIGMVASSLSITNIYFKHYWIVVGMMAAITYLISVSVSAQTLECARAPDAAQ